MHKFYIFELVDRFGIFLPQAMTAFVSLVACLLMQKEIEKMDDLPVNSWHVSDATLSIEKSKVQGDASDREKND